jgi:hypothetical protein
MPPKVDNAAWEKFLIDPSGARGSRILDNSEGVAGWLGGQMVFVQGVGVGLDPRTRFEVTDTPRFVTSESTKRHAG